MEFLKCAATIASMKHGGSRAAAVFPRIVVGCLPRKLGSLRLQGPQHPVFRGCTLAACAVGRRWISPPLMFNQRWCQEGGRSVGSALAVAGVAKGVLTSCIARPVMGGRWCGAVAAATSSRTMPMGPMGMSATGPCLQMARQSATTAILQGACLQEGLRTLELKVSTNYALGHSMLGEVTSRSQGQPGGDAGASCGRISDCIAALVMFLLVAMGGSLGGDECMSECAPKYDSEMTCDKTTVIRWVLSDVPVVAGVAIDGWKVKAVMEAQMKVPVIDLPGGGMIRPGQVRANMYATTRGVSEELKVVIEKGLQPMQLQREGDSPVVWPAEVKLWERVDLDRRFMKVPLQLHGLEGASVADVQAYVRSVMARANGGDESMSGTCARRDACRRQLSEALEGGVFEVKKAPFVAREGGGAVFEVWLGSKEMIKWMYWNCCVHDSGVEIDGTKVLPIPLCPRLPHTPEEYRDMRGRRVIFLGLGGLDEGMRGLRQLAELLQSQNGGWGMTHFMGAFAPLRSDGQYKEFAFADLWDAEDMKECNEMTWCGVHGAPMRTDEAREVAGMALNGGTNDAGVKRNVQNVYAGSSAGAWQQGDVSKEEMRMIMRQEN
jgi:hypothetical protein